MESNQRLDIFEPNDKTALVCMDVPERERIVVEQLRALSYKVHTGSSVEDLLRKMQAHSYDALVISENYGGGTLENNLLIDEAVNASAGQRQRQVVTLVGASLKTADEHQAFQHSVDLVVALADISNLGVVLGGANNLAEQFYGRYLEAITAADVA